MRTIELTFKGPYHQECFRTKNNEPPDGSRAPGVYIWGFKRNGQFIPYYVGKHHRSIAARIQGHMADILKPSSTYMRFNKSYMEGLDGVVPYYRDFQLITSNYGKDTLPSWFREKQEHYLKRITYLNNREFVMMHAPVLAKMKDYPINLMKDADDYLGNHIDNIHVVYSDCQYQYKDVKQSDYYEIIEAFTKFRLKGITVGKSLSYNNLNSLLEKNKIKVSIGNNDKYEDIFKPVEADGSVFPGY